MKEKSENRKAMPKFIFIMIGSLLLGALIGVLIVFMDQDWATSFADTTRQSLISAAPYLIWITALVSAIGVYLCHNKAKIRFSSLRDDDDEALAQIDSLLNIGLLINSLALILSYFLIGIPFCFMADMGAIVFLICMAGFVVSLGVMMIGQQKMIDLTKKVYPEKRGSVYDIKFQKKWYETCDEAERATIGQASYTSYKATNTTCLVLWMALIIGNMLFKTGLLPIAIVTIIWLISTLSYCIHAMKVGKSVHHPHTDW